MTDTRACVFGASGGIGAALVAKLVNSGHYSHIYAGSRAGHAYADGTIMPFPSDQTDEKSI